MFRIIHLDWYCVRVMGKLPSPPLVPNPSPPPVDVRKMDADWEEMVIKSIRSGISLPIRPPRYMERLVRDRDNGIYRPTFKEVDSRMPRKRINYFSTALIIVVVIVVLSFL